MKVLVTGGTGVVGTAAVRALIAEGHSVRLFSRHAARDAARWEGNRESRVEARPGSISSPLDVAGIADGCDAVLHIAGIVEESPPEVTFDRVNVGGTQYLVSEAERAGVRRFVYVSSLGADRGQSAYHDSKRRAEEVVRGFRGEWVICRPGNVYGPGDEVISYLLQIIRSSPVAPVIDLGDQPFQPLWADDLGAALARAVERDALSGRVLSLAGAETTSTQDILDRLARLTGKDPVRLPVPSALASLGARAASMLGVSAPVNEDKLTMLLEENVIPAGEANALTEVLGIQATPLEEGLRRLVNSQPEQLLDEGTGPLVRRRFWTLLSGVSRSPVELFAEFRSRFFDLVPEATIREAGEPAGESRIEVGKTLTLQLPLRGHVQVRVVEITGASLTVVTLAGHPLAGYNVFRFAGSPGAGLRFEVESCDRPSNLLDSMAILSVGVFLKRWTWSTVVENTAKMAGVLPPIEVHTESHELSDEEERQAQAEIQRKVDEMARREEPVLQAQAKARLA